MLGCDCVPWDFSVSVGDRANLSNYHNNEQYTIHNIHVYDAYKILHNNGVYTMMHRGAFHVIM